MKRRMCFLSNHLSLISKTNLERVISLQTQYFREKLWSNIECVHTLFWKARIFIKILCLVYIPSNSLSTTRKYITTINEENHILTQITVFSYPVMQDTGSFLGRQVSVTRLYSYYSEEKNKRKKKKKKAFQAFNNLKHNFQK